MVPNSNSHDAPWLPNSQTEMFSVYAGIRAKLMSCRRCGGKLLPRTRDCSPETLVNETAS